MRTCVGVICALMNDVIWNFRQLVSTQKTGYMYKVSIFIDILTMVLNLTSVLTS